MLSWLSEKPIAHRGYYTDEIVENTLEAFDNAIKHDYNIELDLQLSKENEVVIAHDLHLKRIAGIDKNIRDMSLEELKNVKLRGKEAHIPLFKDVLKLVDGKVNLVIELKHINSKLNSILVDKTIELLKDYKGTYVVQSFNPFIVKEFRKKAPYMHRGQLVGDYNNMNPILRFLMKNMYTNVFSKPEYINIDIKLNVKRINKYLHKIPVISFTASNEDDYCKYLNKYDNVIFEKFNPDKIFKQINLNK